MSMSMTVSLSGSVFLSVFMSVFVSACVIHFLSFFSRKVLPTQKNFPDLLFAECLKDFGGLLLP